MGSSQQLKSEAQKRVQKYREEEEEEEEASL